MNKPNHTITQRNEFQMKNQPKKRVSGQKSALLDRGKYGVFPVEIVQRMVGEITASGENGGKAIMLWFYLLGHVNNVQSNPRFGYAFPNVKTIAKDLKISRNAIKSHCDVLVKFGLMETKMETNVSKDGTVTQTKLYKPLFPMQGEDEPKLDDVNDNTNEDVSGMDIFDIYDRRYGLDTSIGKDTVTKPSVTETDNHEAIRDIYDRLGMKRRT